MFAKFLTGDCPTDGGWPDTDTASHCETGSADSRKLTSKRFPRHLDSFTPAVALRSPCVTRL